ncbi:MAG: hypothetical protein AB8B95_08960 [Pseudohongiellaceae bacterium]
MSTLIWIAAAALCNSLALATLKVSGDSLKTPGDLLSLPSSSWFVILLGMGLYAVSFALTIKIFSINEFARTVPVFIGINIVSSLLLALFFFQEKMTMGLLVGSLFIVSGVWIIHSKIL